MSESQTLSLIEDAYALNLWISRHSLRMVKGLRHTLGARMQTAGMELCLALSAVRHAKRIDRPLARADARLEELRLLIRMALDLGAMNKRQHGYVCEHMFALGKQLGGWRRSLG